MNGDKEFREKHREILKQVSRVVSAPQSIHDKGILQEGYKDHLARLGLLERDNKNYKLTPLGKLLLRQIGLIEKELA